MQSAPPGADMDNFSLKANAITREVVAIMEIEDGAVLEMVIKLPASSPLKRAEVSCRRRVCCMLCTLGPAVGIVSWSNFICRGAPQRLSCCVKVLLCCLTELSCGALPCYACSCPSRAWPTVLYMCPLQRIIPLCCRVSCCSLSLPYASTYVQVTSFLVGTHLICMV